MTEILIYGSIGWEVTASEIAAQVTAADQSAPLTVRINSGGGDVMEGLAMLSSLARHPGGFNAEIDGMAGSFAAVIAMQANTRSMPADGWLMFHRMAAGLQGTADELKALAERMERMEENMISAIARRLDLSTEETVSRLNDEIWLNGEDALAAGFVETLTPAAAIAASLHRVDVANAPGNASSFLDKKPRLTRKTPEDLAPGQTSNENSKIAFLYLGANPRN